MKEELQSKLVEILTSIQAATGKASDFALAQLPDVAQSYVAYGQVMTSAMLIVTLITFCACVFVALRYGYLNSTAVSTERYREGDWMGRRVLATLFGTVFSVVSGGVLLSVTHDVALVWISPKIWLLKELASLVK